MCHHIVSKIAADLVKDCDAVSPRALEQFLQKENRGACEGETGAVEGTTNSGEPGSLQGSGVRGGGNN